MPIPVSSVATAKAYLVAAITTTVADATVLVCYDDPGPSLPDDIVSVHRVERQVVPFQMVGTGGAGWLDEHYTVECVVSVYRQGDDAQGTFERACTLAAAVETAVRADPTLGGAVRTAFPSVAEYVGTWDEDHGGRLVEVHLLVDCTYRI